MHSTRTLIITALVVAAIAAGIVFLATRSGSDSESETPTPTPYGYVTPTPQRVIVRLTAAGVTPSTVTINAGDMVTFRNDTDVAFWPQTVSGDDACSGLDATRSLYRGESYSLTFSTSDTCRYLNHADESNASQQGTVVVQ